MKILVLCPFLPVPPDHGGAIRVWNLLKGLAARNEVDFLTIDHGLVTAGDRQRLEQCCRRVFIHPWKRLPMLAQLKTVARLLRQGDPLYAKYVTAPELGTLIRDVTANTRYDIIEFVESHMAANVRFLHPGHGARLVLNLPDVQAVQNARLIRHEKRPIEKLRLLLFWLSMLYSERRLLRQFDQVLTVSEVDRDLVRQRAPLVPVEVVPNGVDTASHAPWPREGRGTGVVLVGAFSYPPNVDAALHFADRIFPLLRRRLPACTLTVVGRRPPPAVRALAQRPGVFTAFDAADVRPYYREAAVAVVPLRAGGGTRLKILEAMALGTPVVSTSLGSEGIAARHGESILTADAPEAFAEAVTLLIRDPDLWRRLSLSGRRLVEERYDWRRIADGLDGTYRALCGPRADTPTPAREARGAQGLPEKEVRHAVPA